MSELLQDKEMLRGPVVLFNTIRWRLVLQPTGRKPCTESLVGTLSVLTSGECQFCLRCMNFSRPKGVCLLKYRFCGLRQNFFLGRWLGGCFLLVYLFNEADDTKCGLLQGKWIKHMLVSYIIYHIRVPYGHVKRSFVKRSSVYHHSFPLQQKVCRSPFSSPSTSFLLYKIYIFLFLQLHNFMPNVNLFFTTLVCLLICQLYCDLFTPLATSLNKITEFMPLRASPTSAATLGEPSTSPGAQAARPPQARSGLSL